MIAPTCRNQLCPEVDIPKPYRPPDLPDFGGTFAPLPAPDASTEWFCGHCGKVCEVVEQPDTEE